MCLDYGHVTLASAFLSSLPASACPSPLCIFSFTSCKGPSHGRPLTMTSWQKTKPKQKSKLLWPCEYERKHLISAWKLERCGKLTGNRMWWAIRYSPGILNLRCIKNSIEPHYSDEWPCKEADKCLSPSPPSLSHVRAHTLTHDDIANKK